MATSKDDMTVKLKHTPLYRLVKDLEAWINGKKISMDSRAYMNLVGGIVLYEVSRDLEKLKKNNLIEDLTGVRSALKKFGCGNSEIDKVLNPLKAELEALAKPSETQALGERGQSIARTSASQPTHSKPKNF